MTKPSTVLIGFSGPATICNADEIAARLKEGLEAGDRIEIGCDDLKTVDISFIQLVIAIRKSARAVGKTVVLSAPASGALRAALDGLGIQPRGSQDFWFNERSA